MEAIINEQGYLVMANAALKNCPYQPYIDPYGMQPCGDWCPLFIEAGPATVKDCYDHKDGHRVKLACAPQEVKYEIAEDLRQKESTGEEE